VKNTMTTPAVRKFRLALMVVVGALLAGACATTSPPMRFFLLSPLETPADPQPGLGEILVLVGPLQLPGYLDRPQLMVRQSDGQLSLREFDRWAEPLDALLTSTVTANLVRLTGSPRIVAFPLPARASPERRILGRVIRFDADASGMAVLEVQWSISDGNGEPLVPVRIDRFRAQASATEPAALVAALSDTLGQFSRQLAAGLLASVPD
jgi:uncharacterized lipoprotein YmbA